MEGEERKNPSLSFEEIASKIGAAEMVEERLGAQRTAEEGRKLLGPDYRKFKDNGRYSFRFAEVAAAWMECHSLNGVSQRTGINKYALRQYYLGNPRFRELIGQAETAILQEATTPLREEQYNIASKAALLAEEALDEMERLLGESENEHIRFKVAQDLLDRDPRISRTKRIEGTGALVRMDIKVLQLAAQAAREVDGPGAVVPVEPYDHVKDTNVDHVKDTVVIELPKEEKQP